LIYHFNSRYNEDHLSAGPEHSVRGWTACTSLQPEWMFDGSLGHRSASYPHSQRRLLVLCRCDELHTDDTDSVCASVLRTETDPSRTTTTTQVVTIPPPGQLMSPPSSLSGTGNLLSSAGISVTSGNQVIPPYAPNCNQQEYFSACSCLGISPTNVVTELEVRDQRLAIVTFTSLGHHVDNVHPLVDLHLRHYGAFGEWHDDECTGDLDRYSDADGEPKPLDNCDCHFIIDGRCDK
jgi:hypothetical protein